MKASIILAIIVAALVLLVCTFSENTTERLLFAIVLTLLCITGLLLRISKSEDDLSEMKNLLFEIKKLLSKNSNN